MPQVKFIPSQSEFEAQENDKILKVALKNKVKIRYGCGACQCGTCAVKIGEPDHVIPMEEDERALLDKLGLSTTGEVRLACRAKVKEDLTVDLDFQSTY